MIDKLFIHAAMIKEKELEAERIKQIGDLMTVFAGGRV